MVPKTQHSNTEKDIHIRLNQIGYLQGELKEAVLFSKAAVDDRFDIVSAINDSIHQSIYPQRSNAKNWGSFQYYYTLDFTSFDTPGQYYFYAQKSNIKSAVFTISQETFNQKQEILLQFMRQQRCGYNPYLDMVCHQKDGRSMYGPMPDSSFVDASGGWHDAGDQLKYLITGSYATAHMLLAYALYPDAWDDKVNNWGQPGKNGIPDILDEARWGLEWIHKLHPNPDQLIHQIADDRDHIGWKMPDPDPSDYGWGPNSYRVAYFATGKPQGAGNFKSEATGIANLAGRSAAAMALAYRIWNNDLMDTTFATRCLQDAKSLYKLGKSKEGYQQGNSYGAPYRYMERTWEDDMEWSAAELFKATDDTTYLVDAKRYARLAATTSWMPHDTAYHYELYPFINIGHFALHEVVGSDFQDTLASFYRHGIENTVQRAKQNPYAIGVPFIWCSNNLVTSLITQILLYEKMTSDYQFHDFAVRQRDWLFGRNPWGTSMFTGMPVHGEYPQDVHTSIYVKTKKVVPGGLIDGPVYASIFARLKGLVLLDPDEFSHLQNQFVVYHDDIGDYSTNEPTMDGTAGALIMMAYWSQNVE
jgi:hypothetical protein